MSSWEVMLSKGQEWDWYNDAFWRVQTLFVVFILGLALLFLRETRIANPVVDFRPLSERNFAASCVIIFCAYGILYGASTSLPGLLQSEFGYDAYASGVVQSPSGIFSIMGLIVVGTLIGRGVDARWFITLGLLIMAAGNYWMALMNLSISPSVVIWPRVVLITGLSMIFVSINVAAFKYIPPTCAGPRSACSPCSATKGAASARRWPRPSSGDAIIFTPRIGELLDPLNPAVDAFLRQSRDLYFQQTGDMAASWQMALQSLENLRQQQATSLAYFDDFWLFAVLALALVPLVLLMKRRWLKKESTLEPNRPARVDIHDGLTASRRTFYRVLIYFVDTYPLGSLCLGSDPEVAHPGLRRGAFW